MKTEINGTTYYDSEEVQNMLGCSKQTIVNRAKAAGIRGYFISGHKKWYTADQITKMIEYRSNQ